MMGWDTIIELGGENGYVKGDEWAACLEYEDGWMDIDCRNLKIKTPSLHSQ